MIHLMPSIPAALWLLDPGEESFALDLAKQRDIDKRRCFGAVLLRRVECRQIFLDLDLNRFFVGDGRGEIIAEN